jgi:alpha-glucosidase (family GH31 glycosyl hydrolase)
MKAFGLPRLPPYWSLGLQIGADGYSNLDNMRNFVDSFKNASLPFVRFYLYYTFIC